MLLRRKVGAVRIFVNFDNSDNFDRAAMLRLIFVLFAQSVRGERRQSARRRSSFPYRLEIPSSCTNVAPSLEFAQFSPRM